MMIRIGDKSWRQMADKMADKSADKMRIDKIAD